ncbi:MAG TPA: zinc-binding dehydrogenase [Tepidisphaeraceae bacterium]|jgi:threonine dehydrogenase-like Zn-dependent dehydrogenase|nr:zinc-binding dehydrogenase [Tepidisphaeraceae bacterium]
MTAAAVDLQPSTVPVRRSTMRAAVLVAPEVFEMRNDVTVPTPAAGEVRVRIEGCGVCASNIPPFEGREWFQYPMAPGQLGHEAWGRIDAVGEGVSSLQVGDRVAMLSNNAYAEYDVAPQDKLVRLPASLDGLPFPAEPLGCAMNIFERANVRAGQTIAIIGIGFLGAMLTQLAAQAGARVIAISRRPFSLDVARQAGAHEVIPMDDHWQIINRVAELTAGSGGYEVKGFCDVVIEAVGKQWPLDLAAELCAVRGRLVVAGYHQDGPRQINMQLWNWRGLDVINAHERDTAVYVQGMKAAAAAVAAGRLDPSSLYTHTFPLERLGDALRMTRERPDGFLKALIEM